MKLTIERATLLETLSHVHSVVERRNTIPILANVLLEAADGKLSLTATDMDLTIIDAVDAETATPGSTTAPAHTLYDIVRKLPDGAQVELETSAEEGRLTLKAARSRFQLATLPKEDFPAAANLDLPRAFTLRAGELKNMIDRTRFAISTEETRYYLNGVYLHAAQSDSLDVLRAVATDGHRLARFEMPLPEGAEDMPGIIIPRKTVAELNRLIEGVDEPVHVALSDSRINFTFGATQLISKLIDGTFPDYERVIPSGNDRLVEVDRAAFAAAVDRVSTISSEKSRAVKMAMTQDGMTLSAIAPDSGSAMEEIPISYSNEPLEIGFNARYLLDIAQQIDGEAMEFALADAASPTPIRDVADSSALYVLMPMRV